MNETDIARAKEWYHRHLHHVKRMMGKAGYSSAPGKNELADPSKWKGINWLWFVTEYFVDSELEVKKQKKIKDFVKRWL
jgi:hypothetical protein